MIDGMNYPAWRFWIDMILLLMLAGNTVFTWWTSREKVNAKRFRALEDATAEKITAAQAKEMIAERLPTCRAHMLRTDEVEKNLHGIPRRSEIESLNNNIAQLNEKLGKVEGRLDGINRVADLMNRHLISQGGK